MSYHWHDVFIVKYSDGGIAKVFSTEAEAEQFKTDCDAPDLVIDQWPVEFEDERDEEEEEKNEQPPPEYTAAEQRMMGQPHCPKCFTFGYTHRIGCIYEMDGMAHHIRNGVMK